MTKRKNNKSNKSNRTDIAKKEQRKEVKSKKQQDTSSSSSSLFTQHESVGSPQMISKSPSPEASTSSSPTQENETTSCTAESTLLTNSNSTPIDKMTLQQDSCTSDPDQSLTNDGFTDVVKKKKFKGRAWVHLDCEVAKQEKSDSSSEKKSPEEKQKHQMKLLWTLVKIEEIRKGLEKEIEVDKEICNNIVHALENHVLLQHIYDGTANEKLKVLKDKLKKKIRKSNRKAHDYEDAFLDFSVEKKSFEAFKKVYNNIGSQYETQYEIKYLVLERMLALAREEFYANQTEVSNISEHYNSIAANPNKLYKFLYCAKLANQLRNHLKNHLKHDYQTKKRILDSINEYSFTTLIQSTDNMESLKESVKEELTEYVKEVADLELSETDKAKMKGLENYATFLHIAHTKNFKIRKNRNIKQKIENLKEFEKNFPEMVKLCRGLIDTSNEDIGLLLGYWSDTQ